ncbi:MAG TPA: dihydrofolate reductase family protein [Solirubrobacter sp.]
MSNVTFSLSMSLDGFVAGPNDEIDPLHDWLFAGEHPSRSGFGRMTEQSRDLIDAGLADLGAVVCGRTTFEASERWGGTGPFGAPTFVVTHAPPTENRGDFTYVTEGVEAAIEQARAAAGDKDVSVMGAIVPQQAIAGGLVDEFVISVIPVLLGEGKRLFENLGGRVDLERTQVVEAPEGVTHMRFRVVR